MVAARARLESPNSYFILKTLNEQDYNNTGYLYKLQAQSPLLHSYNETLINCNSTYNNVETRG